MNLLIQFYQHPTSLIKLHNQGLSHLTFTDCSHYIVQLHDCVRYHITFTQYPHSLYCRSLMYFCISVFPSVHIHNPITGLCLHGFKFTNCPHSCSICYQSSDIGQMLRQRLKFGLGNYVDVRRYRFQCNAASLMVEIDPSLSLKIVCICNVGATVSTQ